MYRLGNKTRIAQDIINHFPKHSVYVEPFFGTGGMYLNKPLACKNIVNDLDADVHNLFTLTLTEKESLFETLDITPIATATFDFLKETQFDCKIMKAVKFIYLTSFSLFGAGTTMMVGNIVHKSTVIQKAKELLKHEYIQKAQFTNKDFREFFASLSISKSSQNTTLVYNDPPYLDLKTERYNTPKWTRNDFDDLLEVNLKTGHKFAISEFDNPYVLEKAKNLNLRIINICSRKNVRTRSNEILVVNY